MITPDFLIEKIGQGENEKFELKADIKDPIVLSKLIGSFANNQGGQIVVGVREPFEIVGVDIKKLIDIIERTKTTLKPTPKIQTETLTIDNKNILLINVDKSEDLVFSGGSVYNRVGDFSRPMVSEEIKEKITNFAAENNSLTSIAEAIERQSKTISELIDQIEFSNNWKTKLKGYLIGGAIGAILGGLVTILLMMI